jgi:hypothetical protein
MEIHTKYVLKHSENFTSPLFCGYPEEKPVNA